MLDIKRAGHSTLTTPDIEKMVDYFTRIVGLSLAAREKNRAILATKSGLEAIVLEKGGVAEAPRLSLQVAPGSDLGEVASRLKKAGLKSERRSDITPGIGEALAFTDPKGTTIEVFADCNFAPEDNTFTGVMPIKFGHIAYTCPDVKGMVKFYCDVLGFRVSDWRSDFFAFLRCSRDHHTVNFLRNDKTAIHHIAFEVRDWSDIKRACDILARNGIKLTWGPIRHIIGHNIAIYHKNPDGTVIEFFTDLDQMHDEELGYFEPRPWHQDRPQRPKVWGDDTPSNWWGPMSHGSPASASAPLQPGAAPVHHGLQTAPKAEARKPAVVEARAKQAQKKSRTSRKSRRG
jgi:catechol 2,3-dioxygenase-like lactoylglutathione lyase family enzyme